MSSPFPKCTTTKYQADPVPILQPNMETIFQICYRGNSSSSFSCAPHMKYLKQAKILQGKIITYLPPNSCIPSSAKIRMNKNNRKSKLIIDFMELSSDVIKFFNLFQYLKK